MNRKYDIFFGTFVFSLAFACVCLQSCRQSDSEMIVSDGVASLIERGQYIAARNAEAIAALEDPDKSSWFEKDTPYRLLAFTRPYDNADDVLADHLRFNTVAWEGETPQKLHFINIAGDPDKQFGFTALDGETGDANGRVSLDFYGLTYGKPLANRTDDYAALDNPSEPLASLYRTESISVGSEGSSTLNDLYRGVLLNQNIETAGKYASTATQSIMPYTHCFSQMRFMVVQQEAEEPDADGNPQLSFENLQVDNIEVTGTYGEGRVFLQDGKVELVGERINRTLQFRDSFTAETYNRKVTLNQVNIGEMIIFPSDGNALKESNNLPDGYSLGLKITVRSSFKNHIENFLANTGSPGGVTEKTENGETYYVGTIVKKSIIDSYYNTDLKFRQNTGYTLVISFQRNAVRIITVKPQVEEWLDGEGTPDKPWEEQAMGQPQMFDNVVWSDRNLGADHYDPAAVSGDSNESSFEKTAGYFYQAGRNIPYYPFDPANWTETGGIPDYDMINRQDLKNKNTAWGGGESPYKMFPIVDKDILRIKKNADGTVGDWIIYSGTPQMKIPEEMPPEGTYFNFMNNGGLWDSDERNNRWDLGQENQPVSGMWVVPSREDFLTIFPSTPHAGNIVFQKGGDNTTPMNWGFDGTKQKNYRIEGTKTLRITVPFYTAGMKETEIVSDNKKKDENYCKAWRTLHDFVDKDGNRDPGTTHIEEYTYTDNNGGKPNTWANINCEPNGDPSDGYASVYVLSIDGEENETSLTRQELLDKMVVKSWGTIYAIKRVYTSEAYRMRWKVLIAAEGKESPALYVEICRYRCNQDDMLTEENYMTYDWEHPAARLYFPICGLGDHTGQYINFGTECQYATSEPIKNNKTTALQIKITGNNASNAYIAVVNGHINRHFGMQIRPVRGGQK